MTTNPTPKPPWLETEAKVTACKYEPSRMNTLTFGIPADENHFLHHLQLPCHGKTYTDEFTSPTYLQQGETFPITYNPLAPHQNNKSAAIPTTKTPLFTIGIAGSIILSLIWLVHHARLHQLEATEIPANPNSAARACIALKQFPTCSSSLTPATPPHP